jgi:crotonobetainyl-CoA:carnitine CoA-transferase CaiB-like acyl-CoA transferase
VRTVKAGDGSEFDLVANPVQFDEESPSLVRAPELGEHTEEVLLEAGFTWDQMIEWKDQAIIS